jgi:hypothetical protein
LKLAGGQGKQLHVRYRQASLIMLCNYAAQRIGEMSKWTRDLKARDALTPITGQHRQPS